MIDRTLKFRAVAVALGLTACWSTAVARAATEPKPLPSMSEVRELVLRYFARLPGHRPGDILARSEVAPLFPQLERLGWKVTDRSLLLRKVPADSDYLIRKLRTRHGRKFMRRIADYPSAYDRLHRLSWLPHGKQTVHDLIYKVGGHEMIRYMTTAPGGKNLGRQLSRAPAGRDFNKPTGRIYTVEMLLAILEQSHAAAKRDAVASR